MIDLLKDVRLYAFFREDGFYPIELPSATVEDNANCNPGTLWVEDVLTGKVVWGTRKSK